MPADRDPAVPMVGNLADLAATGIASEPTLRKWIAAEPDQPWIKKRGSNGDAYEIDLKAAAQAFRDREEARAEEARARAAGINQLALELGLGEPDQDAAHLTPADRKALLEEELIAIRVGEKRGTLVPRVEVEAAFGDILIRDRQRRSTFASRLAKRADFTREQLVAVERLQMADQADFARGLENWGKDLGDDSSDGAAEPVAPDPAAQVDDPPVPDGGRDRAKPGAPRPRARKADRKRVG